MNLLQRILYTDVKHLLGVFKELYSQFKQPCTSKKLMRFYNFKNALRFAAVNKIRLILIQFKVKTDQENTGQN